MTPRTKLLSRRTVLRGAGGAAIALPWLETMAPSPARAATISKRGPNGAPKRFLMFFSPCGQGADFLKCTNDAQGNLMLAPALAPLAPHARDLLVFNGLINRSALTDPGFIRGKVALDPGHIKPCRTLTTCMPTSKVDYSAGGISIDQAIAKQISEGTKVPSLELGVGGSTDGTGEGISWRAEGQRLPMMTDPRQVFTKLFSDLTTDKVALERLNAERRSILDGVKRDYGGLAARVSGADRTRLEAHLDSIREVEQRLGAGTASCKAPAQPGAGGDLITAGDAHISLLPLVLACDLTRVGSLVYQGPGGNYRLPGIAKGIHDASHEYGPAGWPIRNAISNWFAGRFATLLAKLKALDEGGRSILDNTIVYWCTEHGCGGHNYDSIPTMVAGSGGGYLKTGRQMAYPNGTDGLNSSLQQASSTTLKAMATGPSVSELYVSFLNAMGIEGNVFGDSQYCRGPLPGLEA